MRLRPIGPGVGGLYYSPLLRDARNRTTRAIRRLPRSEAIEPGSVRAVWQVFAGAARRAADRLVEARLAQARADIARTAALLDPAGSWRRPDDIGVRYY